MALLRNCPTLRRGSVRAIPFALALLGTALWADSAHATGFSTATVQRVKQSMRAEAAQMAA